MSMQKHSLDNDATCATYVPLDDVVDYELLAAAFARGDVELVRTTRTADGKEVSLLVVLDWFSDACCRVVPVAQLVGEDEYERPDALDFEPKYIA